NIGTPKDELYIIHRDSLPENPIPNYVQDTNSTPSPRKWHTSVIYNKKLYVWGGLRSLSGIPNQSLGDGTMYIYDITQSVWTSNPTPDQPIGRQLHTATLLPDGRIIMIGGSFSSDVGQLDVYDTKTNQWTNITATKNDVIPPIVGHTATLLPDNQSILICGGSNQSAYSGLAVLNASNYVWTVISPNGTNGTSPTSLFGGHLATLYANVIIFAFGGYPNNIQFYYPFDNYIGTNNTVKILNISND
ncbi:6921_t:CDS:2, partial [Gigaspora rosea]